VRRPKTTPVHELERYMRCKDCSEVRGYSYKRSHLVALRPNKISASDPPSTWWPGERSTPWSEPSASKPRDLSHEREQNSRYRHDNGLMSAKPVDDSALACARPLVAR